MWRGISLANKCLLLFGAVVVLSVLASAVPPFIRMNLLVDDGQLELSRQMVAVWDRLDRDAQASAGHSKQESNYDGKPRELASIPARRLSLKDAQTLAESDRFIARAIELFQERPDRDDIQGSVRGFTSFDYRYAKAIRRGLGAQAQLEGIILLERRSLQASRLLLINTLYLFSAGTAVLGLAMLTFYLITHKLILSPVRALRETAERVREGDLTIRSEISTGDEFEQLAETFNSMLSDLQTTQEQLRSINRALDVKLNELAEANVALYDSARVKGEFLASVSHELRTPLNSIIGFAELLLELARAESATVLPAPGAEPSPTITKRIRYLENIVTASRGLLEMINGLLEMARIEAGKIDLHVEKVNLAEVCQGLLGLISPLADRKGCALKLEAGDDIPLIETDPKKLQQVIFNFLSNAVKFTEPIERTGRQPQVTLRVERLIAASPESPERVRISVIDNGPGIPEEDRAKIFEKFHQLDQGHTREHRGTGLGLAISKELSGILQGEIQLVSELGRGSMFSLILPLALDRELAAEIQLEARFRGTVARRRSWF